MKKVILLAAFVALCSSIFAQSKTEFKEQLAAIEAELAQLKKTDSLNSVLYQAKLKNLEEQIASLTSTINTQNIALKNYADQVERQNNEINALSRLVAIDTALRNNPPVPPSTNVSPREKIICFTNSNNRFKVPAGKTWKLFDFKPVNSSDMEYTFVFVSIEGTQVNKYLRGNGALNKMVLTESLVVNFEIRDIIDKNERFVYSNSRPAPSNVMYSISIVEYDNE